MKKWIALLLALVLALGLMACASSDSSQDTASNETTTGEETTGGEEAASGEVTKIALLLPYTGDQSYFDVTARGLDLLEEKYGDAVECNLIEMGTDAAGWETANRQAAAAGYDIIISGNFEYEGAMLTVADDYPEVKFLNFDYSDAALNSKPNVYALTYAAHEGAYLAGVVAAVKSQSGVIGVVGGMELDGIKQFMVGYMQGALDTNPDIQILTGFVGNFADTGVAKELASNMIAQGADVVYHAAGGAGNGVFEAVSENEGVWAIGVDTDQYVSLSGKPELAETILTSDLKNCDQAVLAGVTAIMDGTAPFGTQVVLTLKDKGVGLAENEYYLANMSEEELAVVEEAKEKIISGEIVVDDQLQDNTLFDSYIAKLN